MLKHIVMWKLKEWAEGVSKEENALKIKTRLESLKNEIKEITAIEVGINSNDTADSNDIVLYSEFKSKEDLVRYLDHPEHKKMGDFIGKVRVERSVVDYEV